MGCTVSHSQPVRSSRIAPPTLNYTDEQNADPPPPPTFLDLLHSDVYSITQGLKRITISRSMRPVIVTGENSYPLVLAPFSFDNDMGQEILLPVIAFSRIGSSRIVFFGDYNILTDGTLTNNDFFENLMSWVTGFKYINKLKICLMGETQATEFGGFSVSLTNCDILPPPNQFDIIFTTNSVNANYSSLINSPMGTSIFFFATDAVINPIKECGVSIAASSLSIRLIKSRPNIPEELDKFTFQAIGQIFLDFLDEYIQAKKSKNEEEEELEVSASDELLELDSKVITLRYYVHSIEGYNDMCDLISDRCWSILKDTEYRTPDGYYFPHLEQSLLAIILSETFSKVHPEKVSIAPNIKPIDLPSKPRKFHISLRPGSWNYTGHYLLPGQIGTIKSDFPFTVQIGSNALQLFAKSGPWKRYPNVAHRVRVEKDEEQQVASPFGGICYILSDEAVSVNVSLSNFTMYPSFSYKKLDLWPSTCTLDQIPVAEFSCKGVTFVMPMEHMVKIGDKEKIAEEIGRVLTAANTFVGPKLSKSHRVVFEIDLPNDEPVFDEVLYWPLIDCDLIFMNHPNEKFLLLITSLIIAEIETAFLCAEVEITFAKVAAATAMYDIWEDSDLFQNIKNDNQKAFNVLFSIALKYGCKPFAAALRETIDIPNLKSGYEAWDAFCKVLSKMTDVKLSEIENLFWEVRKLQGEVSNKLKDFLMLDENIDL